MCASGRSRLARAAGRRLGDAVDPGKPIDGGGSNEGFSGPIIPFGGSYANGVGGYIDTWDSAGVQISLDVAGWRVRRTFEWNPLCCSGNLGATDARLVGYSYQWQADILWDYRNPADTWRALRFLDGLEFVFWLGQILELQRQAAVSAGADVRYPFLWCPEAVIDVGETMLDAIGKKMTRVPCQGRARTHVFVCPAEGMPADSDTIAGAYARWYNDFGPEGRNVGVGV